MQLIRNIDSDTVKKSAVAAIVKFCKESGIATIAEGIETEGELKTLIDTQHRLCAPLFGKTGNANFTKSPGGNKFILEM